MSTPHTENEEHYAAKEGTSIRVTERDDRTYMMAVVQRLVRLFRSQINSGHPKHEDGSVVLDPPRSKLGNMVVSKRTVAGVHIYDIKSPSKSASPGAKRIYYFAGGSWQKVPSGQHWTMCAKWASEIPNSIVSMVSIPIAPNDPAPRSFPVCMKMYRELLAEAEAVGDKIILAGDSSGANVAICLVLEALVEDAETANGSTDTKHPPHAAAVMLISPSTDLTRTNPDIQKTAPNDPLLTPDVISQTSRAWHADWDPADRRVSPINSDIALLAQKGVQVHGITAGYDVLSPDGVVFRNRCSKHGVHGEWLHWGKQMHCFVLTLSYGLREAREGVEWAIDVLKRV